MKIQAIETDDAVGNITKVNKIELDYVYPSYQTNGMRVGRIEWQTLLAFGTEEAQESSSSQFILKGCIVVHLDPLEVPIFTSFSFHAYAST